MKHIDFRIGNKIVKSQYLCDSQIVAPSFGCQVNSSEHSSAVIIKPKSLNRCNYLSVALSLSRALCWSPLPWHLSASPLQSVFVFLLKASSPEPKAAETTAAAAAEPESQDEVFGKGSNHMLNLNLHAY